MNIEININNNLYDRDDQTTSAAVECGSWDKGSILDYVLVEFFNIDIIKFCWPNHFYPIL